MRVKVGLTALLLSVLFWAPGVPVTHHDGGSRLEALASAPTAPASVTVPEDEAPVVVTNAAAANSRGWYGSQLAPAPEDLTADVLAAYTLAVAVSPPQCHITTSVLAAVGQVESGNLAGHTLDAGHRVVPAIMGPVLDGKKYRAVADTDAGSLDGNKTWDRALGPMQIIPASWRVVGLDMDGDGTRDPQNIYDSAGAAMVYLCAGGRDLSTNDGLRDAVLSYNRSPAYLRAVLAWKSVFDHADLAGTGEVPFVASLAAVPSTTPLAPMASPATRTTHSPATTTAARPVTPHTEAISPTASASTSRPATPTSPTSPISTSDPTPTAADPTQPSAPDPTPPPTEEPTTPAPDPTPDPTPLPECPVPTPDATADPTAEPTADAPADEPVVSPETCTPPEGYMFDPETDELVPVPVATPAP